MAKRSLPDINAASMADIAFLLLIFFLLVTTIDTDKGISRRLPPWPTDENPPENVQLHDRNVMIILVNARDQLLVKGEPARIENLREQTKEFVANPNNRPNLAESPTEAVVSLRNDRGTSYDMYIQVQNELTAAYNELRDEMARRQYGSAFSELPAHAQATIREAIPMRISEAEPEDIGGGNQQ